MLVTVVSKWPEKWCRSRGGIVGVVKYIRRTAKVDTVWKMQAWACEGRDVSGVERSDYVG